MTVYFIGAGPGDPELITVKAQKLINACPIILYAGSLVPREIFAEVEDSAEQIVDTASIDLEQIIEHIEQAHKAGKDVARCTHFATTLQQTVTANKLAAQNY